MPGPKETGEVIYLLRGAACEQTATVLHPEERGADRGQEERTETRKYI
jgi:hypothetical protein